MNRQGKVFYKEEFCGFIKETEEGYFFQYDKDYLENEGVKPVSLTLPLTAQAYESNTLFAFFDGLIPEGWLLDIAEKNWKIKERDRMGLLLVCCKNCIGAVSVIQQDEKL